MEDQQDNMQNIRVEEKAFKESDLNDFQGPKNIDIEVDDESQFLKLQTELTSTINEIPFHETDYSKKKQDLSYQAQFHYDIFFEFFAYYVLFYIVIGPLIVILFWRKRVLLKNIYLFTWHKIGLYQYLLWAGNLAAVILYCFTEVISTIDFFFIIFAILMRSMIQGSQFATIPVDRIKKYRKEILPDKERLFDRTAHDWAQQSTNIQITEFVRASKRHEFDTRQFSVQFFVPPMDNTLEKIKQIKISQELKNEGEVGGFQLLSYFIQYFQKKTKHRVFVYSLFNTLSLLILAKIVRVHKIQVEPFELIAQPIMFVYSTWALNSIFISFRQNLIDMQRKIFLLGQCRYLISTRRIKRKEEKLTPSINFHNINSIESWSMMRSIVVDYGASQYLRSQLQYSVIAVFVIAIMLTSFKLILGVINIPIEQLIPSFLFGIYLFYFICQFLYQASKFNQYFTTFQKQLENLQFVFFDIRRRKEFYFKENNVPQNYIHLKFATYLTEKYGDDFVSISLAIDKAIESLQDCIRANQYDSRNYSLRLLSLTITLDRLKRIGMGLCTVYSFFLHQRITKD